MSIFDLFQKLETPAVSGKVTHLIVGLGNPGLQYEATRHNAGFLTLDALAADCGCAIRQLKFKALVGDASLAGQRCLLMKPNTYMNNSGEAVAAAMQFYKLEPENLLVLYDDISLEPGKLRIRRKGSDGGHNGIKSIIALTGTEIFPRIKLGVGKKPHPDYNLADWVLSKFTEQELEALHTAGTHAIDAVKLILAGKTDMAMNRYNA